MGATRGQCTSDHLRVKARKMISAQIPLADTNSRIQQAVAGNYDRLAQIKKRYDPNNLFHMNQIIKPSPRQGCAKDVD